MDPTRPKGPHFSKGRRRFERGQVYGPFDGRMEEENWTYLHLNLIHDMKRMVDRLRGLTVNEMERVMSRWRDERDLPDIVVENTILRIQAVYGRDPDNLHNATVAFERVFPGETNPNVDPNEAPFNDFPDEPGPGPGSGRRGWKYGWPNGPESGLAMQGLVRSLEARVARLERMG